MPEKEDEQYSSTPTCGPDGCAVIHIGWGESYLDQIALSILDSIPLNLPHFLITEENPPLKSEYRKLFDAVIEVNFEGSDINRKSEVLRHLPIEFDTWLFLDADTRILKPITLGFEKAKQHGLAIPIEVQYCLEAYTTFGRVLDSEKVERRGILHYNTGVIFFQLNAQVKELFRLWDDLCHKHEKINNNVQPYLTLAMEKLGFLPYVLSPSYSYRGFGELASGDIYIWHSYVHLPPNLNEYQKTWPMRRVYLGEVEVVDIDRPYPIRATKQRIRFYRNLLRERGIWSCLRSLVRKVTFK